jgi:glutaredoxin
MTRITLLTQDDCTFCDHAKDVLDRVGGHYAIELDEIRLDSPQGHALADAEGILFAPGVLIDDQFFSHGRLSEKKLRRALDKRDTPAARTEHT